MRHHSKASIAVGLVLLLASAGCGPGSGDEALPPFPVIILGLDTVRGDYLGCAGNDSVLTPNLDALATDAVYFSDCQTTAPWTAPAFASLMTGLLPYRHGLLGGGFGRLADEHLTLAEIFAADGRPTSAEVSVQWLSADFGMDQGWDQLRVLHESGRGGTGRRVTRAGLAFAGINSDRPFLLFLHYFEAHAPYTPPAPFDRMYYHGDPRAPGEDVTVLLNSDRARKLAPKVNKHMYDWLEGITDLDFPRRQYAAGVSHVDDYVGQVVAGLRAQGLYDRAMIIVVADHGEHLGEHDFWFTHALPYVETMHVPLLIKFPAARYAGRVVAATVSLVDVMPTVLKAAGLPVPAGLDGVDLAPLITGEAAAAHPAVLAEQGNRPGEYWKALVAGRWKLMRCVKGDAVAYELYDRLDDPGETRNLAADLPDTVAALAARLDGFLEPGHPFTVAEPLPSRKLSRDSRRRLRSLGYIR